MTEDLAEKVKLTAVKINKLWNRIMSALALNVVFDIIVFRYIKGSGK